MTSGSLLYCRVSGKFDGKTPEEKKKGSDTNIGSGLVAPSGKCDGPAECVVKYRCQAVDTNAAGARGTAAAAAAAAAVAIAIAAAGI